MATRNFYSEEEKGEIVNLRMSGMSAVKIAQQKGMKPDTVYGILDNFKKANRVIYPTLGKVSKSRKSKHTYQIGQVVKARSHGEIVVGEIMPITANYTTALILKLDEKQCSKTLFKDHLGVVPVNRNEVLEVIS